MSAAEPAAARLVTQRQGRVLTLTISNPALRNAMTPDLYAAGRDVFREAALEILLDGAAVSAARLHTLGVVNHVAPPGSAFEAAMNWAKRLAEGPAAAHARMKALVYAARGRSQRGQLEAERDAFVASL